MKIYIQNYKIIRFFFKLSPNFLEIKIPNVYKKNCNYGFLINFSKSYENHLCITFLSLYIQKKKKYFQHFLKIN